MHARCPPALPGRGAGCVLGRSAQMFACECGARSWRELPKDMIGGSNDAARARLGPQTIVRQARSRILTTKSTLPDSDSRVLWGAPGFFEKAIAEASFRPN